MTNVDQFTNDTVTLFDISHPNRVLSIIRIAVTNIEVDLPKGSCTTFRTGFNNPGTRKSPNDHYYAGLVGFRRFQNHFLFLRRFLGFSRLLETQESRKYCTSEMSDATLAQRIRLRHWLILADLATGKTIRQNRARESDFRTVLLFRETANYLRIG